MQKLPQNKINKTLAVLIIGIVLFCTLLCYGLYQASLKPQSGSIIGKEESSIIVQVTDKERITWVDGSTYYLVFCRDIYGNPQVFLNKDYGSKYNCSDFQEQLDVNSIYLITAIGERIPEQSAYPNITSYELLYKGEVTKRIENTWQEFKDTYR